MLFHITCIFVEWQKIVLYSQLLFFSVNITASWTQTIASIPLNTPSLYPQKIHLSNTKKAKVLKNQKLFEFLKLFQKIFSKIFPEDSSAAFSHLTYITSLCLHSCKPKPAINYASTKNKSWSHQLSPKTVILLGDDKHTIPINVQGFKSIKWT